MPSPFTWVTTAPPVTDLVKNYPTATELYQDKTTLQTILGTLAPLGTPTTGRRDYQINNDIWFTENVKSLSVALALTQDDASIPSTAWNKSTTYVFSLWTCPAGGTAWSPVLFGVDYSGNVTCAGSLTATGGVAGNPNFSGSVTFAGPNYHTNNSYFGSANQSYFDTSGGLHLGALAANTVAFNNASGVLNGNSAWTYDGSTVVFGMGGSAQFHTATYFGTGNQSSFDTSGNATFQQVLHHGVMYWGTSNQSYGNTDGTLYVASNSTVNGNEQVNGSINVNGNMTVASTLYGHGTSYFGGGNQSYFDSSGLLHMGGNGITYISMGDGAYHEFKWATTPSNFWQAFVNGSIVSSVTPNYCSASLKENIKAVWVDSLDLLDRIPLFSYDWRSNKTHTPLGFIADELEPIINEAVHDAEGIKFIDYNTITVHLVRAVQQLSKRVKELEVRH